MDNLASDLNHALDENTKRILATRQTSVGNWSYHHFGPYYPRKSRSTSNLVSSTVQDSDDTSKDGNESDDLAERTLAKLCINNSEAGCLASSIVPSAALVQARSGCRFMKQRNKSQKPSSAGVESDSFNEQYLAPGASSQKARKESHIKRRRRHKRMAVDKCPIDCEADDLSLIDGESISTLGPHMHSTTNCCSQFNERLQSSNPHQQKGARSKHKKKAPAYNSLKDPVSKMSLKLVDLESAGSSSGKRKRACRSEKEDCSSNSSNSNFSATSSPVEIEASCGEISTMPRTVESEPMVKTNCLDEEMKSDDDSSSTSSYYCSSRDPDEEEKAQEGDDEHSDWVSEDLVEETELARKVILIRKMQDCTSREIRAGRRRVYPNRPFLSIKTSANEKLSKFLQDPKQIQMRLHPMRRDERIRLGQLASLYSLKMHYVERDKEFTCPILTKTSNTTKMNSSKHVELMISGAGPESLLPQNITSENDSKRFKK